MLTFELKNNYIDKDKNIEKFTLFRLLAFTGIPSGECLTLTWNDADFYTGKWLKKIINDHDLQGINVQSFIHSHS